MSHHGCPERLSNRSKGFQEDAPSQPTMEVLVETLTGTAFEMTVSPSDTILAIKSKIFRVEGIPVSQQHILYNMKELDDSSSLRSLGITDGARLRLVLGMRVGPISTRRLPPPASGEPWRDIERLLDGNRDESEWCNSNGCRVTVVVLRDGGRINLLLRQNGDDSPRQTDDKYSSSLTLVEQDLDGDVAESVHDNEVTMGKMIDLRRRMDSLAVRKRSDGRDGKPEIQKTRSEETLSMPRLLDESLSSRPSAAYSSFPLCDYARYDRYTLLPPLDWSGAPSLPPIVSRTDSAPSVRDPDPCVLRSRLHGDILEDVPGEGAAADIRPLVCLGWSPGVSLWPASLAASTDDLDHLKRNSRTLPALSRHRNRSHLHLSDEGLHLRPHASSANSMNNSRNDLNHNSHALPDLSDHYIHNDFKAVGSFRSDFKPDFNGDFKELNTIEVCRNDVETERNGDADRLFNFDDYDIKEDLKTQAEIKAQKDAAAAPPRRLRCTWCRKRLSVSTEHRCRCGAAFCAPHRYAEVHGCRYDYRAQPPPQAPRLQTNKLPKI